MRKIKGKIILSENTAAKTSKSKYYFVFYNWWDSK